MCVPALLERIIIAALLLLVAYGRCVLFLFSSFCLLMDPTDLSHKSNILTSYFYNKDSSFSVNFNFKKFKLCERLIILARIISVYRWIVLVIE